LKHILKLKHLIFIFLVWDEIYFDRVFGYGLNFCFWELLLVFGIEEEVMDA